MTDPVTIHTPRQYIDRGWPAIAAAVEVEGRTFDISFTASQGPLADNCDPFLPAALLTAMRLGVPLHVEGPVSPRLLAHAQRIQEIISCWYDLFKIAPIEASIAQPPITEGRGVGCFFSGGVDSFYSVLKHQQELTHLVFVYGFDITLTDTPLRAKVAAAIQQAAAELDKPLIEVETNLKELCDAYTDWNKDSHGAGMAAVALALAPQLHTLFAAATHTYDTMMPHGSNPLLDALWSTDHIEVVSDGGDTNRWDKLDSMLNNPIVRRYLRTCWENRDGEYNCCRCNSCMQMMVALRVNHVADQFPTYPLPLDLNVLAKMPMASLGTGFFPTTLLSYVEKKGTDPALAQALRTALSADPGIDAWLTASPEARDRLFLVHARLQETSVQLWTVEQRLNVATQHALDLEGQLESAKERRPGLENRSAEAQARQQQAEAENEAARAESARLAAQLYRLTSSRSWRLTAPLRSLSTRTGKSKGKKQ